MGTADVESKGVLNNLCNVHSLRNLYFKRARL
jgi:hypothetical protein